ncbi:RNA polymerase sigma factor [Inquilinus sp.]|uniref:RNA polymerase sigma factor n=1 Tax=Inquilinus sp. TaxID=1932117 RepID=UPI0031D60F0E
MLKNSTSPKQAFEDQISPVLGDLRRYAAKLTRNTADADDLLQETLFRAYRKFHLWQPGTNLTAWLVVMMRRIFLSNVATLQARAETAPIEDWDGAAAPSQLLAIELQDVDRSIRKLSPEHQKMIRIVAANEIPYEEAAEQLDVPVGTVRSRLGRARSQLKTILAH